MHACDNLGRLRSHTATIACHTVDVIDQFLNTFARTCPALREAFPLETRQQRFDAAQGFAHVVKHFGNLHSIEPWLCAMGRRLSRYGLNNQTAPAARLALFNAVRSCSGANWSAEIESDWRQAIDRVFMMLEVGVPEVEVAAPLRAAA